MEHIRKKPYWGVKDIRVGAKWAFPKKEFHIWEHKSLTRSHPPNIRQPLTKNERFMWARTLEGVSGWFRVSECEEFQGTLAAEVRSLSWVPVINLAVVNITVVCNGHF